MNKQHKPINKQTNEQRNEQMNDKRKNSSLQINSYSTLQVFVHFTQEPIE